MLARLALLLLAACGPDTLTVKDAAPVPGPEEVLQTDTAETGSPPDTDTGEVTAPTGDTGATEPACGQGARPQFGSLEPSAVVLDNGPVIMGYLTGPGELCEITCDVTWLEPLVQVPLSGCENSVLPVVLDDDQNVEICVNVSTPPSFPATGHCVLTTGEEGEIRFEVTRDN